LGAELAHHVSHHVEEEKERDSRKQKHDQQHNGQAENARVNAGLPQYSFVGLQAHSFLLSPMLGSVWLFRSNHCAIIVRQAAVLAFCCPAEAAVLGDCKPSLGL
jgi:hypothetical protein